MDINLTSQIQSGPCRLHKNLCASLNVRFLFYTNSLVVCLVRPVHPPVVAAHYNNIITRLPEHIEIVQMRACCLSVVCSKCEHVPFWGSIGRSIRNMYIGYVVSPSMNEKAH